MFGSKQDWTEEQRKALESTMPVTMPRTMGTWTPGAFDTAEGVEAIAATWRDMVRNVFTQDGKLNFIGFIFCTRDPRGISDHVVLSTEAQNRHDEVAKEALAKVVRLTAAIGKAAATITVFEAWMCHAKTEDYESVEKWRSEHNNSIEGHPDTFETAVVLVETHAGCMMHLAKIHRAPDGRRTMGEWETPFSGGTGRFVGLLKPENWEVS